MHRISGFLLHPTNMVNSLTPFFFRAPFYPSNASIFSQGWEVCQHTLEGKEITLPFKPFNAIGTNINSY